MSTIQLNSTSNKQVQRLIKSIVTAWKRYDQKQIDDSQLWDITERIEGKLAQIFKCRKFVLSENAKTAYLFY